MKKIKYIMPLLFLCQLYAAEDNLLVSEQLDDGIPSEYEPIFSISELETELQNQEGSHTDLNVTSIIQMSILDGGSIYQFTNCNTTGASGPTQDKINIEYSGTNLQGLVTSVGGMQNWTVPISGLYHFEVKGAMGGSQNSSYHGGYGAVVTGSIELQAGQELLISVGQKGIDDGDSPGGGGATAVALGSHYSNASPLFVAGGGGGRAGNGSANYAAINGQSGINGGNSGGYYGAGSNGNGAGYGGHSYNSGGGAGFFTGPDGSTNASASHARGFRQGYKGSIMAGPQGGFGGGGAGSNSHNDWDKGGAGGYSGGAQAFDAGQGGGGGSYIASNVLNQVVLGGNSANNSNHGIVIITSSSAQANSIPEATNQTIELNEDNAVTINLTGVDEDGGTLTFNVESSPTNGTAEQGYSSVLDFDGSNDYVKLPDMSYLNDFSFSAWFKIDSRNYWERIFDFGKGGQGDVFLTTMGGRTGGNMELTIHPFGQTHTINPGMTCDDGQWHHVIFTYDKGGAGMALYIDGQNKGTNPYNTHSFSDYGDYQNFYLGKANWNDPLFDGQMEQVGIYQNALSASEVQEIYNGGRNFNLGSNSGGYVSSSNLIGYWKMNEGSGSTLVDHSGNSGNAIIHNGPSWLTQGSSEIIVYTPNSNFYGQDSFTFSVSDGIDQAEEYGTVTINVLPVNDVPTINSIPALNIIEGELYEYYVSISDLDGDQVSLSVPVKPGWLNLENGSLVGTPSFNDGGLHSVVLNADDGNGGIISQEYAVSVAVKHLEISGESGFRILSSPVSGPVFGDLLEELWTQGSIGSDHEGADPNVWRFDNGWVPVSDLYNDNLEAGEGFVIYVFADTDYDGDDDLPVTIGIDGTVNESSMSVSSNASDWNLVGNPYGLHVDISQMLTDNRSRFHSTVYKKDDVNPGYKTHNGVIGDIDQGLIKPFDGFWVQAGPEGTSFDFSEHCMQKGHMVYDGGARSVTNESTGSATFTFSNGEFTSSVYLSFTEDGEINLDPADAKRIVPMSPAEHLTSMVRESSKSLSINNLPYALTTDLALEVDVMLLSPNEEGYETQAGQVNLTWDIMDLPEGISLTLVNNFTGQNINLYGFPSANVNLPSKGGFSFPDEIMQSYPFVDEAQFSLYVSSDFATSENDEEIIPDEITLHNAYPNPFNPSTMISFEMIEVDKVSLNIFDVAGRKVASLINNDVMTPGHHKISWNPGLLPSGVYLVELVTGVKSFNQKITYIK